MTQVVSSSSLCVCVYWRFANQLGASRHTHKLAWARNNIADADQKGSGEGGATALPAATRAVEPNVRNSLSLDVLLSSHFNLLGR